MSLKRGRYVNIIVIKCEQRLEILNHESIVIERVDLLAAKFLKNSEQILEIAGYFLKILNASAQFNTF